MSMNSVIIGSGFGGIAAALRLKAKKHNVPYSVLKVVFNKGMGAYSSSGSRPGMSAQQWSYARVNSFLNNGPARRVDKTQWKKVIETTTGSSSILYSSFMQIGKGVFVFCGKLSGKLLKSHL